MNEFEKKLYDELLEELEVYAELGTPPVRRLTGALSCIDAAVSKLKKQIEEKGFSGEVEEIHFFKYVKPVFLAEQFFATEIFHIESARKQINQSSLQTYYEQELIYSRRFFEQHQFLYAYYLGDMHELDKILFLRGTKPVDIPVPDTTDLDPAFSTCGDKVFAKFRAFERVQSYLMQKLQPTGNEHEAIKNVIAKWPGEKTDLIELGYALYNWLRIHKSKVTMVQLFGWLEQSFGISLQRHHQRFGEIKMRKITSRTKFMDELIEALNGYMDDGDAWMGSDG